ncbi:MAG: NADP-dependent oxidoreductase [Proteobacteria bacterium]|nr:NADP-dependent oxidoreductase [Pseudomonadota bacterium]
MSPTTNQPINRQFRLAERPQGVPTAGVWDYVEEPARSPDEGEMLVKVEYISLDPAMRGWMNARKSYIEPVGIGEVMRAGAVGEVLDSKADGFAPGDKVYGVLGVQTHATVPARGIHKIDATLAPIQRYLGALGMPGMTAYFGLLDIGRPEPGQTVVVSGAAGAVGSLVGQIAKIKGCRAIGIAGGPDKCRWVVEQLGFDGCIDYKSEDVYQSLKQHCPDGVDVYFDNVGGDILDAVLRLLAMRARIVICGAISQYNNLDQVRGPANYMSLLVYRARMEGFVVLDYAQQYSRGVAEIAKWIGEGKLIVKEDIRDNFERFPEIFGMLFKGDNLGKLIMKP